MITPSFALTATERVLPKLALDFTTASLDPRITFTRAGNTATVVNSAGYVAPINADLPRFDYDPVTLVSRGLLIEESRINLITYSATYSNIAWSKTRSSVSTNSVLSPDGGTSSFSFIEDTNGSTHFVRQTAVVVVSSTYIVWAYVKANTRNWVLLTIAAGSGYYFDVANGVVGSAFVGTGTVSNPFITAVGNGWYRCGFTVVAGSVTGGIDIYLATGNNGVSYTGNGSSGVYIWGSQIELGSFATSYIPTTATSLTRNRDSVVITGTNFSDWFSGAAGTFMVGWTQGGYSTSTVTYILECIGSIRSPQQTFGVRFYGQNGSNVALTGAPTIGTTYKSSIGYTNGSPERVALNGGAVSVNGTNYTTVPTSLTLGFSTVSSNFPFNGWMRQLNWYQQQLTNAELSAVSK